MRGILCCACFLLLLMQVKRIVFMACYVTKESFCSLHKHYMCAGTGSGGVRGTCVPNGGYESESEWENMDL